MNDLAIKPQSKPKYVVMIRYVIDVPVLVGGDDGLDENADPVTLTSEHEARLLALRIAQQTHVLDLTSFMDSDGLDDRFAYSDPTPLSVEPLDQ